MFGNIIPNLANSKDEIEIIIEIGRLAVSVFTLLGALIGGIISIRKIIMERRDKQMSDFISMFSDENDIKRLSAINGISHHIKILFKKLFFICSVEKDTIVQELIYDELHKHSAHMKKQCVQINDFIVTYLHHHNFISKLLPDEKNKDIVNTLKYSQTERRIWLELNSRNLGGIFEQDCAMDNHLLLSSRLLTSSIAKSFSVHLSGCLIVQADMYASKWVRNIVDHCVFIQNVARHMVSVFTEYKFCYIDDNNYFDSKLFRTHFINCIIRKGTFRNSNITHCLFRGGKLENVTFNKSIINKCCYTQIEDINECYWSGCTVKKSKYEDIRLVGNTMKDTKWIDVHFADVQLFRNEFLGEFVNCHFKNVVWGGSDLNSVLFVNCTFENVDFAGAHLKHTKFTKCEMINTDLSQIKSDGIEFENCKNKG